MHCEQVTKKAVVIERFPAGIGFLEEFLMFACSVISLPHDLCHFLSSGANTL